MDQETEKLKKKIERLEKRFETFYNRFYALAIRRRHTVLRRQKEMDRMARNYGKWHKVLTRLAPVADGLRDGERQLITVTREQSFVLRNILAGRRNPYPRRMKKKFQKPLDVTPGT